MLNAPAVSPRRVGLSTFLLRVIFIGIDPDNLTVGAAAAAEGASGIALGSILGGVLETKAAVVLVVLHGSSGGKPSGHG
jgi:hypothetical protein